MTIPYYRFGYNGDPLPASYPPLADRLTAPTQFTSHYIGTPEFRKRIARALSSYAATQFSFWQFSLAMAVLGALAITIGAPRLAPWFVPVGILVFVIFALIMPVRILAGIRKAAEQYALSGELYGAAYTANGMFWKVPSATYEVTFDDVDRMVVRDGVAILGLKGSRAVCVLPAELAPGGDLLRLSALIARDPR